MRDYASLFKLLLVDLGFDSAPYPLYLSDMGVDGAARVALASSFYKKLCPSGNSKLAEANALEKFTGINSSLPEEPFDFGAISEVESLFWDFFTDNLNTVVGPSESLQNLDLDYLREHMMVGPGAAQKADSTYMVSKLFESTMSYTNDYLIQLYRGALVETGFWADAEMHRFQKFGFTKVPGGKLFFAPKNAEISRTCCTEANVNMLVQKAIGTFLEYRLEAHFGIRLKEQPDNNRKLARIGSIDGSFGTIDLASASDSIGLQLMLRALRSSKLKTWMLASRSETAVLPDGSETVLRMISTMGNGFTFPLQTVIFACAVRSVYQLMGFPCRCPKSEFGVFGDDIIVRRETYDFVCAMLVKLGFSVNVGKSFNTGPFRESCGHDYYNGVNIRGVYVRSLEIPQYVYSLINRLTRWSAFHNIRLYRTIALLQTWVRDIRVPPSEADDAGIHVPFVWSRPVVDDNYWFKYRCYLRHVKRLRLKEPDDPCTINPDGMAVGFLSGHIRRRDFVLTKSDDNPWSNDWGASVSIRDKVGARARYKIAHKSIPYWDYLPDPKMAVTVLDGDEWRIPLTRDSYRSWSAAVVAHSTEIE